MTVHAGPSMRTVLRACLTAAGLLIGVLSSFAGDRAQADYLGFSPDGRYFAFEQYGIHDGSGGFYSDIFVVDLANDTWLAGVPFSAATDGEDETASLAETRATALEAAQSLLQQHDISNPVAIGALVGDGVLGDDGMPLRGDSIHFGQPFYGGILHDYTLALKQVDVANSAACLETPDGPYQGFVLTLTDNETDATRELHADTGKALPGSRGCALRYSIYSIVFPLESEGDPVALISIYTQGFEGPDRRFMAVPIGML